MRAQALRNLIKQAVKESPNLPKRIAIVDNSFFNSSRAGEDVGVIYTVAVSL